MCFFDVLTSDRLDCLLGLSLLAGNNLRVLANRFEWHPANNLFVYSVCLSLPELPACLYLGLWAPQQTYCWGQFRQWKCLTPGKQKGQCTGEVVAGESGRYNSVLDIRLLLHSSSYISITVPNCCLSLTVSCYCQWKVLKPLPLRQWKQPVSCCCVRDSQLCAGLLQ